MTSLPVPNAAIAGALIAALISLLGLVISKESKTSEFRQTWIDALRKDIARLITHANALQGARCIPAMPSAQFDRMRADFIGMNEATARIRLRLREDEDPSNAVLDQIDTIERLFAGGEAPQIEVLNAAEKELVKRTKVVLREEWLRVRRGEPTFRIAKALAAALVIGLAAVAITVGMRQSGHPQTSPVKVASSTHP